MFKENFEKILETGYPAGLHKKIMRRAYVVKYRGAFLSGAAAAFAYSVFSAWNLWAKIMETDFVASARAIMEGAGTDLRIFADSLGMAAGLAPAAQTANFAISIILAVYIAIKLRKNYKFLHK